MTLKEAVKLAYAAICPLLAVAGSLAGAWAASAPHWGQGDDCMIPRNFFAVVFGIIGAVAGGAFGLVVGIGVVVTCEGDNVLEGPVTASKFSSTNTLLRPALSASGSESLMRAAAPMRFPNKLLLREPSEPTDHADGVLSEGSPQEPSLP